MWNIEATKSDIKIATLLNSHLDYVLKSKIWICNFICRLGLLLGKKNCFRCLVI